MKMLPAVACLLALATFARPCLAQYQPESQKSLSFGIGGGISVPVSDVKAAFHNGWNGRGYVQYRLLGLPFSARMDFALQHFGLDSLQTSVGGTGQLLSGVASMQYGLPALGPVHPYLLAGLGMYQVKTTPNGADSLSTSEMKFGLNGGAGVRVKISSLTFFAEGHIDNVYTDQGLIDTKTIKVVPVTFGVVF
jgi:opacity protein-like surface antigen